MNNNRGYILVEILITVQILLVIVLFIVTVGMFNRFAIQENELKQSALFLLQREMEQLMATEISNSLLLGYTVEYAQHIDSLVEEGHHGLEVVVTWTRISNHLANIKGVASWHDGKRLQSKTLITKQFVYAPGEEESVDDMFGLFYYE